MAVFRWRGGHRCSWAYAVDVENNFAAIEEHGPLTVIMHRDQSFFQQESPRTVLGEITDKAVEWLDENTVSNWKVDVMPLDKAGKAFTTVVLFYEQRDAVLFYLFWCGKP